MATGKNDRDERRDGRDHHDNRSYWPGHAIGGIVCQVFYFKVSNIRISPD
jgi:hypothetical protein